ncbi:hypothetical protein GCE86_14485 [Micromonospora terminaliae]|uniref:Uncharacterized protein n=1 Tax=Micromonospora terminaliae TaxID=1914461 RepID=A0AAJ3DIB0_9ACTN|nr:hypothetical protein [Micromonospora terminaliae]NES27106.1 hypothetical protein [Micromonospora terminaliae]QGL48127.1 hypothetical protein GCE86_14485 [Micromonospora terminaliae]
MEERSRGGSHRREWTNVDGESIGGVPPDCQRLPEMLWKPIRFQEGRRIFISPAQTQDSTQ